MTNDLILHHYPNSPFSEKVRLVLGHKKLAWKSVVMPSVMPKPDLVALTGGYRRTPVLQIGADIYCDTALICDVLEHQRAAADALSGTAERPGAHAGAMGRQHAVLGRDGLQLQPARRGSVFQGTRRRALQKRLPRTAAR